MTNNELENHDIFCEEEVSAEDSTSEEQSEATTFKISLVDCGSTYNRSLYSVSGKLLLNSAGTRKLNLVNPEIREAFENKELRLIHHLKEPSYRYFVTSNAELRQFQQERDIGAPLPFKKYFVYVDDDVEKSSYEYRSCFKPVT